MSWTQLAERFSSLPLILVGPMLRRCDPQSVTVWLALKEARTVTLRVYQEDTVGTLIQRLEGTRQTIRLGDRLHIVAITARVPAAGDRLTWGASYSYNLFFQADSTSGSHELEAPADLSTPGILTPDPSRTDLLHRLLYPGHSLPGFVLPPEDLNKVKLLHGSCRKPHGFGKEMLSSIDTMLEDAAARPSDRPQQLFLTGDQIYGDDVADPLLFALIDAADVLLAGNEQEILPLVHTPACELAPGARTEAVRDKAMLTTTTPRCHLLSFAEYATMYLFAWSDVLWPDTLPGAAEIWNRYPETRPGPGHEKKVEATYDEQIERLGTFQSSLPQVRRALANIPTYMNGDDHDVTDDWYLDGAWCQRVLASALGRRVMRNAILAFALFQAWGNTPDQFQTAQGLALLDAVQNWGREKSGPQEETISDLIGVPASFGGSGELPRSELALQWNYTFIGPRYQLIVLDTRTHRLYRSPSEFPGLLSPEAMKRQVAAVVRRDVDVTVIISASPVLGVGVIEALQYLSRLGFKNNYALDPEAWDLEWGTFQAFLSMVSPMKRVVFLAGDVHYAFAASLDYWDQARSSTAKIVNFTSSPLRNEGSAPEMAMLAAGYPLLYHLLRHTQMPTLDFFAWDIGAGSRDLLQKMLNIIRSRIFLFWWSIPRLIDAKRSPYEIVLHTHGWPRGAFDKMPPDRSYRLRYIRDVRHPIETPAGDMVVGQPSLLQRTSMGLTLQRSALSGITFAESILGRLRHKLAKRAAAHVLSGGRNRVRGALMAGSEFIELKLEKCKQRLKEALFQREQWLGEWKAGAYIIGYANIGEIGFDWAPEKKSTYQRLWWWSRESPERPALGTEYHETLELPTWSDAPPLP
jgi:hypothetical protein